MEIKTFFDNRTYTLTYVVWDEATRDAVVIDPVLDYEAGASKTFTESVDAVIELVRGKELHLRYILETHAHADHLSGSQMLGQAFPGAQVAISERITHVQKVFKNIFDMPRDFPTDGSQFDRLLSDGEVLDAGGLRVEVINTPGHTPACVTFKIGDALFTGDTLFMPDQGTGRCDFPGGNARDLYDSVARRIYGMPDELRIFVGHDYQPGGRALAFETTVGEQKRMNTMLPGDKSEAQFIDDRETRDQQLSAPKLLFQSVQINVDAGRLPTPRDNEIRYLQIPINVFRPTSAPDPEELELVEARDADKPGR